jgi:hypothetical protein
MIKVFNSAYKDSEPRYLKMDEVNVVSMKMDYADRPYILFEHKDYPLGALSATFDGEVWSCDLD